VQGLDLNQRPSGCESAHPRPVDELNLVLNDYICGQPVGPDFRPAEQIGIFQPWGRLPVVERQDG
jgi:hypothetical protein